MPDTSSLTPTPWPGWSGWTWASRINRDNRVNYDITKYTDVTKSDISKVLQFKNIDFNFKSKKTFLVQKSDELQGVNFAGEDYSPENITTIDGVRAKNNFGWWLIRASNTEEALIIRFEGKSIEDKEKLFLEVQKRLKKEGLTLEFN